MLSRLVVLALPLLLLAGLACTPSDPDTDKPKGNDTGKPKADEVKIDNFQDQGTACLSGSADQAHTVTVDFNTCLSSSCDKLESASCTVEQSGTELVVHGKASVSRKTGVPCTEDCRRAETTCSTGPLAAGSYSLSYADKRNDDIVVPLTDPACTQLP